MGLPQDYAEPKMDDTVVVQPYPAQTRQAAAEINGVVTDVMSIGFTDKIMITITQNGRLAQWVGLELYGQAQELTRTQRRSLYH